MISNWQCPFCGSHATIREGDRVCGHAEIERQQESRGVRVMTTLTRCPNPNCDQIAVTVSSVHADVFELGLMIDDIGDKRTWELLPESIAKTFPDCVPKFITDDYKEACLIRDLSPKASATLSRRCLQGMIRDFFNIKNKGTLFDEINAIKSQISAELYKAIDSIRSIGNIGAHMEKDTSLLIEVDPNEAEALIKLIEYLIEEWYVARDRSQRNLAEIAAIAKAKKALKEGTVPATA